MKQIAFSVLSGLSLALCACGDMNSAMLEDDIDLAADEEQVAETEQAVVGKYTMAQRFGMGHGRTYPVDDHLPLINEMGLGWYHNWSANEGPRQGLSYVHLVGGYAKNISPNYLLSGTAMLTDGGWCQSQYNQVLNNPSRFSSNSTFTVGNEIGYDDGRTAVQYAREYVGWYKCLKAIGNAVGKTFNVGTGSLFNPNAQVPTDHQVICTTQSGPSSAYNYFIDYVNEIKTIGNDQNASYLPDLVFQHAYLTCSASETDPNVVSHFWSIIHAWRTAMKTVDLQDRDLFIKEFGLLTRPMAENVAFMDKVVPYMANENCADGASSCIIDSTLGNPGDGYRLVQKWAWFLFDPSNWPNNALLDPTNLKLTTLGEKYRDLRRQYTSPTAAGNGSSFVSQSNIPAYIGKGQTASVSVVMKNTGTTTWTPSTAFRLGSQALQDNSTWGLNRVALPVSSVAPGQQATFTFNITAPSTVGERWLQLRMVRDGVEWFGDYSKPIMVDVTEGNKIQGYVYSESDANLVRQSSTEQLRGSWDATVSYRQQGTTTWTNVGSFSASCGAPFSMPNLADGTYELRVSSTTLNVNGLATPNDLDVTTCKYSNASTQVCSGASCSASTATFTTNVAVSAGQIKTVFFALRAK